MNELAKVVGLDGNLLVFHDHLVIDRNNVSGFLSGFKHKDRLKYYYFSDISRIDYRKPGIMGNGYFTIYMPYSEANSTEDKKVNTITVESTFFKKKSAKVHAVYELIMQKMKSTKTSGTTHINVTKQAYSSRLDELQKLGELKASGVLTQEEFEKEKQRILNG